MAETDSRRIGEVVEASTTSFTTQCYRLYEAAPLGSLVRSGDDPSVFGVVSEVSTRSMDPSRRPVPRGAGEDTEEGVYQSNPQLTRLLCTEFTSVVVGHRLDGRVLPYLAPTPPRIYSFVHGCDDGEIRALTGSLEFLRYLLDSNVAAADDVVVAFLRQASASHPEGDGFLVDAGKELAGLLAGQLQRLNALLRRLSP